MACCIRAVDDHGGRQGNTLQLMAQWRRSVAPREALAVLYRAMRAKSQWRIRMVIDSGDTTNTKIKTFSLQLGYFFTSKSCDFPNTKWTPYSANLCAVCIAELRQHDCS